MIRKRRTSSMVVLAIALLAVPSVVRAQSAIAGVVKDTSGAVLPGVTVEAASDVLIEKTRSVTTDGVGQFKIIDLRPGVYSVTFSLPGFQSIKREGIELQAEFTATINTDLKVGSIEETIVVTTAAPVVDVSSAAHIQVLDKDTLDSVPTGRTIQGIGQIIVGVNLSLPDVGGSRAAMQTYMSVHGQSAANNTVMVDGLTVNGLEANGAVQSYFNDAASQEMSYQTSGIGAETSSGGVRLNLIPREGGNRFSGDTAVSYRPGQWQGDNLTERLTNSGLTVGNSTQYIVDFTASQGGPILKDKLWFFGSYRNYDTNNRIANTFYDDGSQGDDFNYIRQGLGRVTYQLSTRNKIGGFYDRVSKYRAHDMQSLVDPETASAVWTSPDYHTAGVKYTSTISSRILLEAGYSENIEFRTVGAQDGILFERGTPEWFANASRTPNTGAGRTTAPSPATTGNDWPMRRNIQASTSYITGSHHIKGGVQWQWGTFYHSNDNGNADLVQRYRTVLKDQAGAITGFQDPVDVRVYNSPVQSQERLNADLGLFVQDSWTLKRLTVNAGVRWEYINAQVDTMTAPAGRFVPERTSPEIVDLPVWSDWAPRFHVVYDLFGNAKTAIKYSINRYNAAQSVGVAQVFNGLGLTAAPPTLSWTDLNGDNIAQGARVFNTDGSITDCVYQTPGCEVNLAQLSRSFGLLNDPGVYAGYPRPYNIEQGFEIQHELLPRLSLTGTYYRGYNKNLTTTINTAITPADYTLVTIFNPIDGTPMDYYNISAAAQGRAAQNVSDVDPDRFNHYQSYSAEFRARPGSGLLIFGGVSWERELSNGTSATTGNCTVGRLQNPNQLRFCDRENLPEGQGIPFAVNARLNVTYAIPWQALNVSLSMQHNDQGAQAVSYQFDRTTRYPDGANLVGPDGTPFPACPSPCTPNSLVFTGLTPANATLSLFPAGSQGYRNERLVQFDVKVQKTFRYRGVRISPAFEAFNLMNADTIVSYSSTNYATSGYLSPNSILQGRVLGVATSVKW